MKYLKSFLILLLILILIPMPVSADDGLADEITKKCTFSAKSGTSLARITDGSTYSLIKFSEDIITISSDTIIGGLYIKWDVVPDPYTVKTGNEEKEYGARGFMHEYIDANDATLIEISVNNGSKIAEIEVYGKGKLPSDVQVWDDPHERADLLLFPTHADDEHLFFGGIMPMYAGERGLRVQVVYLTYHYAYRTHELLDGLWAVGITAYPVISPFFDMYADSLKYAKSLYDENEFREFQIEQIRRFKPYVIVGHDLNGEYGHGVHMLNAHMLCLASEQAGNAEIFPESAQKYGVWDPQKTYLHLYTENQITLDYNVKLFAFNGKTALEVAFDGWHKHKSQQSYFDLEDYGPNDCRLFGLYRTTVGPDVEKKDLFENIVFEKPKASTESDVLQTPNETPSPKTPFNYTLLIIIISVIIIAIIFTLILIKKSRR